ncbi:MAG: hypothetical protein K2F92_01560 [Alistipes sp.]|nr:hypothetical protein [Alistipes sp.]
MKRILVIMAAALCTLTSCIRKQTVLTLADQRDSLTSVVDRKDSLICAVFEDINAIAENLSRIKARENLLTVASAPEGGVRPIAQINDDIADIDRLLQENRSKIASLQRADAQLRKADLKIAGLEKMIRDLEAQLKIKAAEIDHLRTELYASERQVRRLENQVAERNAEVITLNDENIELATRLHRVYYIVGAEKELRAARIINKEGFIGRTLTMGRNNTMNAFTKADDRLLGEVPIMRKRITLVTPHPADSYRLLVGPDKAIEKLQITDPVRFWESSKVLIVSYK